MIYFISDSHFNHFNLCKDQKIGIRPFKTVEEMNQTMIDNWNKTVSENDTVFHMGDFGFGKKEEITRLLILLNGRICLTKGNHCKSYFKECGFADVKLTYDLEYNNRKLLLRHKPIYVEGYDYVICGHTHDKSVDDKRIINVCVEQDYMNYSPISIVDLEKIIDERENKNL